MTNYRRLAWIYLKQDKKRSVATIIGVTFCVILLFILLNLTGSYMLAQAQLIEETQVGEAEDLTVIIFLTGLLISYIFAILGVGIIRNAIQMNTLEQLKDYGILRCIGATKKQLRGLVYRMGMLLELAGIIIGIPLGFFLYIPVCKKLALPIGFAKFAVPFILLAFLGDLVFVMQENCKFINALSPAEAILGVYRIKKEKIKANRGKWVQKIFGFECAYAYKNVMRRPSRFFKSVLALGMGIAMILVAVFTWQNANKMILDKGKRFGYYELNYTSFGEENPEIWEQMKGLDWIEEEKDLYVEDFRVSHVEDFVGHFTEEYRLECYWGNSLVTRLMESEDEHTGKLQKDAALVLASDALVFGFEPDDYARLKKELKAGTTDLSENGIILINYIYADSVNMDAGGTVKKEFQITDYQVGDSISFVDFQALQERVSQKEKAFVETNRDPEETWNLTHKLSACADSYRELQDESCLKTYVIEGIVQRNAVTGISDGQIQFVLPLDRYLADTGYTEEMTSGVMYHIAGNKLAKAKQDYERFRSEEFESGYVQYVQMEYLDFLLYVDSVKNVIIGIAAFLVFIMVLTIINMINVVNSGLHLRRKEFAQLRVIGMSKRKLRKMVVLEGIITAVFANVVGFAGGFGLIHLLTYLFHILYDFEVVFPYGTAVLTALLSFFILGGMIDVPLRKMKNDMASHLMESGE
ncbi:MAG: FtsX-like permease family protein [Lachnospiraceae bacterium]